MNFTVKSLYLCVRDMERAIRFYDAKAGWCENCISIKADWAELGIGI